MIVVTGGAGFIGSCYIKKLNDQGIDDILVVDHLASDEKWKNLRKKKFRDYCEKDTFLARLLRDDFGKTITAIHHIGACSSTTENNASYLVANNYEYSQHLARHAIKHNIYFAYASSAATYGDGGNGYSDNHETIESLMPLNMYGFSKHLFDLWIIRNKLADKVVGFKYFNVFGPNEYHKEDMRSLVCKAYDQIQASGKIRLFKSYKDPYRDGEQKRDFVYIKDVVDIMAAIAERRTIHGIVNIGTGCARSWNDLARAIFAALGKKPATEYIPMPETIKEKYQYFTEADMHKLSQCGIPFSFRPLEASVADYIQNHLTQEDRYW